MRKTGTNFLVGPVVIGQGALVLNQERIDSDYMQERNFFAQRGRCPVSGNIPDGPVRALSNLVLLRDVGDVPAHCKMSGLDDFQGSLPTPTVL